MSMSDAEQTPADEKSADAEEAPKAVKRGGMAVAALIVISLVWLLPVLWAFYTSLRPYADTAGDPRSHPDTASIANDVRCYGKIQP